jgi:hypothetical protein
MVLDSIKFSLLKVQQSYRTVPGSSDKQDGNFFPLFCLTNPAQHTFVSETTNTTATSLVAVVPTPYIHNNASTVYKVQYFNETFVTV